ncbi:MAG: Dyp-type peroxidase [Angustibacter sp.]
MSPSSPSPTGGLGDDRLGANRRRFLQLAATAASLGIMSGDGSATDRSDRTANPPLTSHAAVRGALSPPAPQEGVVTPRQAYASWLSYDLSATADPRARLAGALQQWSVQIEALPRAADATVTVGLAPAALTRLGLAVPGIDRLPAFPRDQLQTRWSDGDVLLQVCADDDAVVTQTVRELQPDRRWRLTRRWLQTGSLPGPTSAVATPRNPLGFKDGTANPVRHGESTLASHVWIQQPQSWRNGTWMVVRRIALDVARFTTLPVPAQEAIIGRTRGTGAPLSGSAEFDPVALEAKTDTGRYLVPRTSHVRLAHPLNHGGRQMVRRSYGWTDGSRQGLVFVSFQHDPATFVAVQDALDEADALNEYATTVGSALFLVPPRAGAGSWIGSSVLGR